MQPPKRLKDLNRTERNAIGVYIKRLCMERAIAQICIYLGHESLSDSQQRELIQIMRDNFERFNPNQLWLDHRAAKRLQQSFIDSQMILFAAENFMKDHLHDTDN